MREIIERQIAEVRRQLTRIESAFDCYTEVKGVGAAQLSAALATAIRSNQRLLDNDKISFGSHKTEYDYRMESEGRSKK